MKRKIKQNHKAKYQNENSYTEGASSLHSYFYRKKVLAPLIPL